jgi:hypothetical protein
MKKIITIASLASVLTLGACSEEAAPAVDASDVEVAEAVEAADAAAEGADEVAAEVAAEVAPVAAAQ